MGKAFVNTVLMFLFIGCEWMGVGREEQRVDGQTDGIVSAVAVSSLW